MGNMRILRPLPINHRLRPLYRFLAGLAGLYVLVFGIVGAAVSRGHAFFSRDHIYALGLRTNLAFSILSIVVGAIVLLGVIIGRNVDQILNLAGGLVFLLAGMFMLLLPQTDLHLLNHTVAPRVASVLIGMVLSPTGVYSPGGCGGETEARAE